MLQLVAQLITQPVPHMEGICQRDVLQRHVVKCVPTLIGFLKILMDQVKSFSVGKTLKTFLTGALLLSAMFLLFPKIPRATAVVSRTSSPLDKNIANSFFRARLLRRPLLAAAILSVPGKWSLFALHMGTNLTLTMP